MPASFRGFPKDLFTFLRDLSRHNNREWFQDNKDRYRDGVVEPVCNFVAAVAPGLAKISKQFVADPRPHGGSMFRIYRDTRFSHDKRPYKEHIGCHFRHRAGKDAHAPGFYLHLAPAEIFYGGGIWMPPGAVLFQIRQAISERPRAWSRVVDDRALRRRFGGIEGDQLKRAPRGFRPDHPHAEDIRRKTFFVLRRADPVSATRPGFLSEVTRSFRDAGPLMRFLTEAVDLPYAR